MIFQYTINQVLDGSKTQTRRIVKPEHNMAGALPTFIPNIYVRVGIAGHRKIYEVGKTYAVCPGRGKSALGRIRITSIRQERVQDITPADAWAEIGDLDHNPLHEEYIVANQRNELTEKFGEEYACYIYRWMWNRIHLKKGERWEDNPVVWVLEFELAE